MLNSSDVQMRLKRAGEIAEKLSNPQNQTRDEREDLVERLLVEVAGLVVNLAERVGALEVEAARGSAGASGLDLLLSRLNSTK